MKGAFLASSSLGLFEKTLTESQIQEVSRSFVDNKDTSATLLKKMAESGKFVGNKGEMGPPGPEGKEGPPGPATWPKGEYCILSPKWGKCPAGFKNVGNFYACFPNGLTHIGHKAATPNVHCDGNYSTRHINFCCTQ